MSRIQDELDGLGVRPNRKLGQNFLTDSNIAQWIVNQLDLQGGDSVVEVGPGVGALTKWLVGRVRRLILIEFDHRLAENLRRQFAADPSVEVIHADAAKFDPRVLWKYRPLKFLGNLPYSSGGAIMRNFLSRPNPFSRAVVMLQKEVVDRMVAQPRSKSYGVLSLRVQSEWQVSPLKTVPPEAFFPRPAVDSMVAVLTPQVADLPSFGAAQFDQLIRMGFAQRRKQLRKNLTSLKWEYPWQEIAKKLEISEQARAEELSLSQWIQLARIYEKIDADSPQSGEEILDVVDENDEVVRQEKRSIIHRDDLLHRAVHIFVTNARGEVALQQRAMGKDSFPGCWDTGSAGHVDAGEAYLDAAERELREELGIFETPLQKIGHWSAEEENGWEHVNIYSCKWQGKLQFPSIEIRAVLWLKSAEITKWLKNCPADFAGSFAKYWEVYLKSESKDPSIK